MEMKLFFEGLVIGLVVAVPVGPIGLLCINRFLAGGRAYGLFSGLGVAAADAIAAGIAALGLTLISDFLFNQQLWLRPLGGLFLCYLGFRTFVARPSGEAPSIEGDGLLGAYTSTFLLTFSNPLTILSFFAIYAGWGVESLKGHYLSAAILMSGVFAGSALWWIILGGWLTFFRAKFTDRGLQWMRRVSGVIITGFGFAVLLNL